MVCKYIEYITRIIAVPVQVGETPSGEPIVEPYPEEELEATFCHKKQEYNVICEGCEEDSK